MGTVLIFALEGGKLCSWLVGVLGRTRVKIRGFFIHLNAVRWKFFSSGARIHFISPASEPPRLVFRAKTSDYSNFAWPETEFQCLNFTGVLKM